MNIEYFIKSTTINPMNTGFVYIIGAGPGDPELITVKGINCLKKCDVVFYDASVESSLAKQAGASAKLIKINETITNNPSLLDELNEQIIKFAKDGKTVGVLQEGDPFIFGLGAEIAREAVNQKIKFAVVPGITSAIAAAAYAGIPLTFRGYSSTLAFATGHTDLNKKYTDVDWEKVACGVSTMVFFMGLDNLDMIVKKLTDNGRDERTPIAIVSCGTTDEQETLSSTIGEIAEMIKEKNIKVKVPAI
ncbi:MAG: uroporphyrinogen-III C-methyltransferase, partial [Chlamydiae bacterium]